MRRLALLCVAVVGIASLGCGDDDRNVVVEPRVRGPEGTWSLFSLNGQSTPFLLGQNDTATLELLSSRMSINADASYSEIFSLRMTVPSGVELQADTIIGTFAILAGRVIFQPSNGAPPYEMEITDENTLTESEPGLILIYKRN